MLSKSLLLLALVSGQAMAKECVDLTGKYRMKLEEACSKRSLKSLINLEFDENTAMKLNLADNANAYWSEDAFLNLKSEYIEFDIEQVGCEKLKITYRNTRYTGSDLEWSRFNYDIKKARVLNHGFKFKKAGGTFSGNGGGDAGVFGLYREKNKFKIVQSKHDKNQIHLKSSMKAWGALFLLIPFYESDAFLDCTMDKVEE